MQRRYVRLYNTQYVPTCWSGLSENHSTERSQTILVCSLRPSQARSTWTWLARCKGRLRLVVVDTTTHTFTRTHHPPPPLLLLYLSCFVWGFLSRHASSWAWEAPLRIEARHMHTSCPSTATTYVVALNEFHRFTQTIRRFLCSIFLG